MTVSPSTQPLTDPKRKLFFGLFIFPLVITVAMAIFLCGAVLLTHESESPESLIAAIKSGAPSKRWQKAFELSNELNRSGASLREQGIAAEIIHILKDASRYDAQTRSYMALALTHFKTAESVAALRESLKDSNQDVRLYSMWALGSLGAREASPDVAGFLGHSDEKLRKMAAYVVGVLQDKTQTARLEALLDDPAADVRWNSALSLARLGVDKGWGVLMEMLERDKLSAQPGMSEAAIEKVMTNAMKGLAMLPKKESLPALQEVAQQDKNLRVRETALEVLRYHKDYFQRS